MVITLVLVFAEALELDFSGMADKAIDVDRAVSRPDLVFIRVRQQFLAPVFCLYSTVAFHRRLAQMVGVGAFPWVYRNVYPSFAFNCMSSHITNRKSSKRPKKAV
jgi:hypothetical protein